jgi:predicted DNA-binding protein
LRKSLRNERLSGVRIKRQKGLRRSMEMQVRHNITLDEDVSRELDSVAAELGEKKSAIIEKALETYFDLLDLKLAKKRLADLEKGSDQLLDSEEVWKKLGI